VSPDVANMLNNMHVTKVIAGRFGEKFKDSLEGNSFQDVMKSCFIRLHYVLKNT